MTDRRPAPPRALFPEDDGTQPLVPRPGDVAAPPMAPAQPRPAISPEMAFATLHLLIALVVLTAEFASAYRSIDRIEPDEEAARNLHTAVLATAVLLLGAGVWLSQRISPWVTMGVLAGLPLGVVLLEMATSYTHTECWSGFWWSDCRTEGNVVPAIHALVWTIGVVGIVAAIVCRLGVGPRASAAALLGSGMALAAAFAFASVQILLHLHEEAVKAAEANKPVMHDTPALGWAFGALGIAVLAAMHRRRSS